MSFTTLLKKYSVPGPRYTSYPTVPAWERAPTGDEWIDGLKAGFAAHTRSGTGGALYVHIPFCESLCTYCGCNTRITRNRTVGAPYVETVLKELSLYTARLGRFPISEIHLGGGTPTFLTHEELETLMKGILAQVELTPHHELSIEADPRVTTREHLATLARLGFRRLSLGIQDFDPKVQETVHRIQSEEQVRAIVEAARELGFTSIGFDLIYGLPFQTQESVSQTIDAVRRLRPDRIAFYSYAHVPWIKASQRRFTEADLPDADSKRALYELGRAKLEEVGYREIGMDHFALETDSLWKAAPHSTGDVTLHRNFMGYTSRNVWPLIGLGVSAIGDSVSDAGGAFAQNEKLLETYVSRVQVGELPILRGHVLSAEDLVLRKQILNLMTRFETEWTADDERVVPYLSSVGARLAGMAEDRLVELTARRCRVTPAGRAFLRNICMAFDARLASVTPSPGLTPGSTGKEIFSKTV